VKPLVINFQSAPDGGFQVLLFRKVSVAENKNDKEFYFGFHEEHGLW